ncbi:MAG: 2-oxoisovalerate dehydrogenase component [Candidatus Sumerlaeota bacterium]|nr:2-oxoisovalerate dehydrogenase component [Candidatus Sumerlaeota bacterium]
MPETQALVSSQTSLFLDAWRHMVAARHVDVAEQDLLQRGEGFFTVSGAGHEASALLAPLLTPNDWLHCHYRDKALMLARGMHPIEFIRGFLCRGTSHSAGRQMSAHMGAPELNILSMAGPVGNNALPAVGVAAAVRDREGSPLVLCANGDGTTQEGELLEAIGEAVRHRLPVLFVVQDNEYAISTITKESTFYSLPGGKQATSYCGIPIRYAHGWDAAETYNVFSDAVAAIRETRQPAIVVLRVKRLWSHTNADDQRVYRTAEDIRYGSEHFDPIAHLRAALLAAGIEEAELERIEDEVRQEVTGAVEQALDEPEPTACHDAKAPLPTELLAPNAEKPGDDKDTERLTMLEAIREVLRHNLLADERVSLYGQDIEDPKGDVFGITKGLTSLAPGRVKNAPLAEATIVGTAIGRALAGERPVAFLQFADFFPLAFNQVICEMGSIHWRTKGDSSCPVIVMITCGGYRPGLGPFHAHTHDSIAAHIPGVDVMMPSTAADAAGLLNAAFKSGRPTLFFYPKNCLNDRTATTSAGDVATQLVPPGRARVVRQGTELTFVAWGNCVVLCRKAAETLASVGVETEVIDLRTLSPWDRAGVVRSAEKTGRVVVVHEDNLTCGFGAEVVAAIAEDAKRPVAVKRVARGDTFVPCNFSNQLEVLPSYKTTLEAAASLLGYDVTWELPPAENAERFVIEALGSSPSDESLTIIDWKIAEGDEIQTGQLIAEIEADKAAFELTSPVTGQVEKLLVAEGESIKVGLPMVHVRIASGKRRAKPVTQEQSGTPTLKRRDAQAAADSVPVGAPAVHTRGPLKTIGLSRPCVRKSGRVVSNDEVRAQLPGVTSESITERTGIVERSWIAEGESALSLGADAARELLENERLKISDIDLLLCATGTPTTMTPSMACLILNALSPENEETLLQAYDINAACSGYLFALQAAFDFLQSRPESNVMIVTTEVLSPMLDMTDEGTCILFGDAATATLLVADDKRPGIRGRAHRPVCLAKGDDGTILSVPAPGAPGHIHMQGKKVFSEAVTKMTMLLQQACAQSDLTLDDLDLVVPHQANQRIIDAIRRRAKLDESRVFSNIRTLGNTSSSTIPICLHELLDGRGKDTHMGLCAFGGGFTFGAAIVEKIGR